MGGGHEGLRVRAAPPARCVRLLQLLSIAPAPVHLTAAINSLLRFLRELDPATHNMMSYWVNWKAHLADVLLACGDLREARRLLESKGDGDDLLQLQTTELYAIGAVALLEYAETFGKQGGGGQRPGFWYEKEVLMKKQGVFHKAALAGSARTPHAPSSASSHNPSTTNEAERSGLTSLALAAAASAVETALLRCEMRRSAGCSVSRRPSRAPAARAGAAPWRSVSSSRAPCASWQRRLGWRRATGLSRCQAGRCRAP